jgi:hypothetical protein
MTSLTSALGFLLLVFAWLFELAVSLFLIGLGLVAWASGPENLQVGMFPWEGAALERIVLIAGLVGLVSVIAAGTSWRWLFPLWSLFAVVMMIRGFFLSSYSFAGTEPFQIALWLTAGALVALVGSLRVFKRRAGRREFR